MKKITEVHFCDYCGVEIPNYSKVRAYTPVALAPPHTSTTFSYTRDTYSGTYCGHEFCSELCFVLDIAKTFGVELTAYTDSESK